jgi:adenosylmethionine-8-amino-7-oxononanoate aminotransferase
LIAVCLCPLQNDLLLQGLTGNSRAAPFVFDIRGGGGFWAIEFDFSTSQADFKGDAFAMVVQARAMNNGMIIMGMTGGADLDGKKGDHIILSPAYNITKEEVETIAKIFIRTVEEVLDEYNVH